jgi:thiamine kinase-like enzyme
MLQEYEDILAYLMKKGFIKNEHIVDKNFSIENASLRNCNLKIASGSGANYFLKQDIREGKNEDKSLASIGHEAEVYKLFEIIFKDTNVYDCLPRYYAFDPIEKVLLLEAITDSVNLAEYYMKKARFSPILSGKLGKVLGIFHQVSASKKIFIEESIGNSAILPWIFFIAHPGQGLYLNSSQSNLELIRIIQQSAELSHSFEKLSQQWKSTTLIHGDVKFVNCLVCPEIRSKHEFKLLLVDWELARIGDPCWDIGSTFSEYLIIWLSSIPISMQHSPDEFLDFARFPLKKLQPSIRSFWKAYTDYSKIGNDDLPELLLRSTCFAAVRLVQSAYEQSQIESNISTKVIFLLQLSSNILQRPFEACIQLLGLSISNSPNDELQLYKNY